MTAREFLLKRFPTNKYWDCPVPKHYWEIMEEYAKAYHEEQVKLLAPSAVNNSVSIEREALLAFKRFISKTPQIELEYYSDEEFTDFYLKPNSC